MPHRRRPKFKLTMKAKRFLAVAITLAPVLAHAAPQFYVAGQGGISRIEAESVAAMRLFEGRIKSGSESCFDIALGWRALDWLSIEGGYASFGSFSSGTLVPPDIQPVIPMAYQYGFDLECLRLTAVARVYSRGPFSFAVVGGVIEPRGTVTVRNVYLPSQPVSIGSPDDVGFHAGLGASFEFSETVSAEGRIDYIDLGKVGGAISLDAMTYTVGLAWHF